MHAARTPSQRYVHPNVCIIQTHAEPTDARPPEAAQYSGCLQLRAGERLPLLCSCVTGNRSGGGGCSVCVWERRVTGGDEGDGGGTEE